MAASDLALERALLFRLTRDTNFLDADRFYAADLASLNDSGATGTAVLAVDDDAHTLTVAITATGLEADQTHIQHIHGFIDGTDAKFPTIALDTDGDGFLEVGEGAASYGPVMLNLARTADHSGGSDNGHSHGDVSGFPTAPGGNEFFLQTYQLPAGDLGEDPLLDLREVVIHGLSVPAGPGEGTPGEVDGTGGYKLALPVASGEIALVATIPGLREQLQDFRELIQEAREAALSALRDLAQERGLMFGLTGDDGFLAADHFYTADLAEVNDTGVNGTAVLALDDDSDTLTVAIAATGLEPNQTHIQHIHGFADGTDATVPTLAQDTDDDGFIELQEGAATYGPVLLNLARNADHSGGVDNGHSHGNAEGFPTAPNGDIFFVQSYQLPAGDLGADPLLTLREVVVHGASVAEGAGAGTGGEVDGTAGYKLILPAAIGEIELAGSAADFRAQVAADFREVLADIQRDLQQTGAAATLGDFLLG